MPSAWMSHLSWEVLSTHKPSLLSPTPGHTSFNGSQYLLLLLTHSFIWQTAIERLMVLGTEDSEMIKTQAPGTSICLKYAFYIDKVAIKLKKDSFFC